MTLLDTQLGIAEETTFGTVVTPDRFYEILDEGVQLSIERIESGALRKGQRVLRSDRWAAGQKSAEGPVELELANKSFGLWFKHALGTVATSQPDATNAPTVYDHTFTPGDLPTGLTVQPGRPQVDGTVQAFTYHGCKIASWELACAVGEIAGLSFDLIGEDEDTSTALASASYPADLTLMTFVEGSLTIAGSAVDVASASVSGDNVLADDRYFLGSALRKEPLEPAMREYTGTVEAEFTGLTAYNRFINGTEAELILKFEGANIEDVYNFTTQVKANVRFDGETPTVAAGEIIPQPLPFKVVDDSTTSIEILYRTTDTTP